MYHFLSGYTAKVAGTEKGVSEPQATFSTCFGAPFMPRHPCEYGNLLRDLIATHEVDCWLVNTGWTGGNYGVGRRMPIQVTRQLLRAALDGSLGQGDLSQGSHCSGFRCRSRCRGSSPTILDPVKTWADPKTSHATATRLVAMFRANFVTFEPHVSVEVLDAQPSFAVAAE